MTRKWQAIVDEAALAAEHIAIGVTALGRANYAQQAYYYQSFFALSVGLERSAKLALIVNHALNHDGAFQSKQEIKAFGHGLTHLLDQVDLIAAGAANTNPPDRLPRTQVHLAMVAVLNEFATNITRYYNIEVVADDPSALNRDSPVAAWYSQVIEAVADIHYSDKQRRRDQEKAQIVDAILGSHSMVRFHDETGEEINSLIAASLQQSVTTYTTPYVRMYVLQIARFFWSVFSHLTFRAYHQQMSDIPHLSEFFALFGNEDSYLKKRSTWSIYRP